MNIVTSMLSAVSPLPDGDTVDRINYCYTTTLLIVASVFVSGWSFVGSPIQCWFPAYYRGWWMEYALDYCYVQNTYFLRFTDIPKPDSHFDIAAHIVPLPKNHTEREEKQIGYYQWIPFVLAFQALGFFLPVVFWRSVYNALGLRIRAICETCSIKSNMEPGERSKNLDVVARFLVSDHEITDGLLWDDSGKRRSLLKSVLHGRLVVWAYLATKLAYATNALAQFLLVKWVLGADTLFWGWTVAQDLALGREWPETGNFPRVTLCDFSVRVLGNLHHHSVQCVLMINMFNEKIFVFLWFWFALVAALSSMNCLSWICRSLNVWSSRQLISIYLDKIDPPPRDRYLVRKALVKEFFDTHIRSDGMLIIRLIALNSGDLVACQLVANLWRNYLAQVQALSSGTGITAASRLPSSQEDDHSKIGDSAGARHRRPQQQPPPPYSRGQPSDPQHSPPLVRSQFDEPDIGPAD